MVELLWVERELEEDALQDVVVYLGAGCHLVQPGTFEFKLTPTNKKLLADTYAVAEVALATDFNFHDHRSWTGRREKWISAAVADSAAAL